MLERIESFIDNLKKQLQGLPEHEIGEAVDYYMEYLHEAAETEKDLDEVFRELGTVESIAGAIRTESSIATAQRDPGLRNFSRVLRNAFRGVTKPFSVFLLSLFIIVAFSMVAMLFAGALTALLGAVVLGLGFLYQTFTIPLRYTGNLIGTIGAGAFGAGICLLTAYGLYRLGRLFIRLSSGSIRRIRHSDQKPVPAAEKGQPHRSRPRRMISAFLILTAAGLILMVVSGLPVKLFYIFNSMKPEQIIVRTAEFEPGTVNKISVVTAHSHIKLVRSHTDKIGVTYEQPDWLDYELGSSGSMLSFLEKSNGSLPLFKLTSMHESVTLLTISLPENYSPDRITLESTGGVIVIEGVAENIQVKTFTGDIRFDSRGVTGGYTIKAVTKTGTVEVNGEATGQQTKEGREFYLSTRAGKTIEMHSSSGHIRLNSPVS